MILLEVSQGSSGGSEFGNGGGVRSQRQTTGSGAGVEGDEGSWQ